MPTDTAAMLEQFLDEKRMLELEAPHMPRFRRLEKAMRDALPASMWPTYLELDEAHGDMQIDMIRAALVFGASAAR